MIPFQFTIKPLPLALLVYWAGWLDIKIYLFSNRATVGYFLMTVGVWIVLSRMVHIRNKRSDRDVKQYQYSQKQRLIAAWGLVLLPGYTLFHWWYHWWVYRGG